MAEKQDSHKVASQSTFGSRQTSQEVLASESTSSAKAPASLAFSMRVRRLLISLCDEPAMRQASVVDVLVVGMALQPHMLTRTMDKQIIFLIAKNPSQRLTLIF